MFIACLLGGHQAPDFAERLCDIPPRRDRAKCPARGEGGEAVTGDAFWLLRQAQCQNAVMGRLVRSVMDEQEELQAVQQDAPQHVHHLT